MVTDLFSTGIVVIVSALDGREGVASGYYDTYIESITFCAIKAASAKLCCK